MLKLVCTYNFTASFCFLHKLYLGPLLDSQREAVCSIIRDETAFRHCYRVEFHGLAPMGFVFFLSRSLKALEFEKMWADTWSQHGKYASKWKWSNGCPQRQLMQVHKRRSGARNGSRRTVAAIRNCHPGFALHSRLSNIYGHEFLLGIKRATLAHFV